MIPYHWQYLPLLMQILFAIGLAAVMVLASWFVGRHRNLPVKLAAYECGIEAVGDARAASACAFIWSPCCSSCSTWKRSS